MFKHFILYTTLLFAYQIHAAEAHRLEVTWQVTEIGDALKYNELITPYQLQIKENFGKCNVDELCVNAHIKVKAFKDAMHPERDFELTPDISKQASNLYIPLSVIEKNVDSGVIKCASDTYCMVISRHTIDRIKKEYAAKPVSTEPKDPDTQRDLMPEEIEKFGNDPVILAILQREKEVGHKLCVIL